VDIDFDWSVCQFEYIENPELEKPNENDIKYLKYSQLVIKAKELGLGYFCDWEDTLHLVPVPIISCDEQGRYHSIKKPAIHWKGGEEIYYLNGVRFEKEWWTKIVNDTLTPDEVFAINNAEHRRIAYEFMDKAKMKQLKDYKVLDEAIDNDGNTMKIFSFTVQNMKEPLKFYNCIEPTTKREFFLQVNVDKCWEAKKSLIGITDEVEFIKRW